MEPIQNLDAEISEEAIKEFVAIIKAKYGGHLNTKSFLEEVSTKVGEEE